MQPPPDPAQLTGFLDRKQLDSLAPLYDRFANAFDPFDPERDQAERTFSRMVMDLYSCLDPRPSSWDEFRRAVVRMCRHLLKATARPPPPPPKA